jgi:hypothetical protein
MALVGPLLASPPLKEAISSHLSTTLSMEAFKKIGTI